MEVGHKFCVIGNVLSDFVDEEVQAEVFGFTLDVSVDLFGEILDRKLVVRTELVDDSRFTGASDLVECRVNAGGHANDLFAAPMPCLAFVILKSRFEIGEKIVLVEFAFELSYIGKLTVVAAMFIKDFHEHGQQCVHVFLADDVGFLVDIKQNAFGWNRNCFLQRSNKDLVVFAFLFKRTVDGDAFDIAIFQQHRHHLQQVRFARTKEAGNPDAICIGVVIVRIKKLLKAFLNFISEYILFYFVTQSLIVVGLDDAFDFAINWFYKYVL